MKRGAISLCLAFGLAFTLPAPGADWPQFRGLNRDGKSPETGLLKSWPADGLRPLWVAEGLGQGFSGATVADGIVYVTGMAEVSHEGALLAFNLDGKLLWRTPYGQEWEQSYPGARASVTIDAGRLYLLSSPGLLVCCDVKTGATLWSKDITKTFGGEMPRCGFVEGLLVHGGIIMCTPGGKDAALAGLDKQTGETRWVSRGFGGLSGYCSPILVERGGKHLALTLTARHLVGVDPVTGSIAWSEPFDPVAEDPNHSVSPVYENGCVYATSGHGEGGRMFEVSPSGEAIHAKWTDKSLNNLHGGVVAVGGYLYGSNLKGKWVCLDLNTGAVMYEAAGVGMGSVAYADGMLYCYGEKGTLGLAKASPSGFELVGSFKVTQGSGQHWAHPVIAGGRLYIRHGDVLLAYDITAH